MVKREREKRETVICKAEGRLPLKHCQTSVQNIPQNLILCFSLAPFCRQKAGRK